MRKILTIAICMAILNIGNAHAIRITSDDLINTWGAGYDATESAGDFIISGCIGKSCSHGTNDDEWGIVGIIADTITEHGAHFCPYQLQCGNQYKKRRSWTMYYHPSPITSKFKCAWLCEPGYSGTNCASQSTNVAYCDKKSYKVSLKTSAFGYTVVDKIDKGMWSGIHLKTSGGDSGACEDEIIGFRSEGNDPECDWILGVIQFLEHGVIAAPIKVCCGRDNWKYIDSFVNTVYKVNGSQKILCANGYTANESKTDCVPINPDMCALQDMNMCANFEKSGYNSSIHYLEQDGGCAKFFCSDPGKAFPAVGKYTCEDCATGAKGGANRTNGVCVRCETGQYFDKDSNSCQAAKALSKLDLQYGIGQTKNTRGISKQCWTIVSPEEYKKCIKGESEQK